MEDSNNKKVLRSDPNRIDALPNSVLCNILFFLDMKEVMATSVVSRRWRYLWKSVSVLNFDHYMWVKEYRNDDNEVGKNRFMNFVDRVLLLRDGLKVNKFNIICAYDDSDRLDTWLTLAARRQFQEVHLDLYANDSMELPGLIFSSAITVFKLVVDEDSPINLPIKIPSSVSSSPQLKTLILDYVVLPEGNSNGELVLSCPVLENLTLKQCVQTHLSVLIISTPQLKRLVIESSNNEYVGDCHIKIWTPNLISLDWSHLCCGNYSFINLSNLVTAVIFLIDEYPPKDHNLVKVLEAVSYATKIDVSFEVSKEISNKLISQFLNLRCLTLRQLENKLCFRLVLKLLKNAPCIETLVLIADEMEDFEEEEVLVFPFMLSHLKSVEFGMVNGCENEVKFLKFLLKNAIVLEELIIKTSYSSSLEKLAFGKRMRSLARASSSITVIVV